MKRNALALFIACCILCMPILGLADLLEVVTIDVGQGDAILLRCGGMSMLIDAGTNKGSDALLDFLDKEGVTALTYAVGTHPHEDHIGGLDVVIDALDVENIWMPRVMHDTRTFEDVLLAIQAKGLTVHSPQPLETHPLGDATITLLGPVGEDYHNLNLYSIALRVDHGENSFLFTGDAETQSEGEWLEMGLPLAADVLKVGHHGSYTSSSEAFLAAVNPQVAIISCGADNSYGHPHRETMEKLYAMGVTVLRTDLLGHIRILSDGETLVMGGEDWLAGGPYIGNRNSRIFHAIHCNGLPKLENQVHFAWRGEALQEGYIPCRNCNP